MKEKKFITWYYADGLSGYLEIFKDLLFFGWDFFSVIDLLRTLFYPWKRDAHIKNWTGFDFALSTELWAGNLIARIVGAFVGLGVILFGLISILISIFFGIFLLFLYITLPVALIVSLFLCFSGDFFFSPFIFFLSLLLLGISFLAYKQDSKKNYSEMMLVELAKEKWFERILKRLGIDRAQTNPETWENFEEFKLFLQSCHLTESEFAKVLSWEVIAQQKKENKNKFWTKKYLEKINPVGRNWKYAYTNLLDKFCLDLTKHDPTEYADINIVDRTSDLQLIELLLKRTEQNSVLLTGDPGIGKKTLVHYLSGLIRSRQAGDFLNEQRILNFDLGAAVSYATGKGEDPENFLRRLFSQAAYAGNIILYLENFENLLGGNAHSSAPDFSGILEEYVGISTFQIIATTTQKGYHRIVEKHENLIKYFEVVEVKELSEEDSFEVLLRKYAPPKEIFPVFSYTALKEIVKISGRYFGNHPLPERALDLAEEALVYAKDRGLEKITVEDVDDFAGLKTGVSLGELRKEEQEKLLHFEEILHHRIIGQNEAIQNVAQAVRKIRSGVVNQQRPAGTFLFLGPTGVGKTETAKALAEAYFGGEEKMLRFDMSEYQNQNSLDRLIGSEQTNEPGRLTTLAKDHPFSLLLLDEIEKAHPKILDIFLQILDEGFVTDALGEKINFRNMIIIATSNAGAFLMKKMAEEKRDSDFIKNSLIDFIGKKEIFRLEFLNRFDNIIIFKNLIGNELQSVTILALNKFSARLRKEKNIQLIFEENVARTIIEKGYNPTFGARSINHFISEKIEDIVAKKIIAGELKEGEKVLIGSKDFA